MIKLYVAGPYNGEDVMQIALNMHNGIKVSTEMRRAGFAVYCPWDDFLEALFAPDLPIEVWRETGLEHLRSSNAMLVVDILKDWRKSIGTLGEIEECLRRHIPIFYYSRLNELMYWREGVLEGKK